MRARGIWAAIIAFLATDAGEEIWGEIRQALVGEGKAPLSPTGPPAGTPPSEPERVDATAAVPAGRAGRRAAAQEHGQHERR